MMGALFVIAILAIVFAVVWDLNANPYRIEETVMGTPPKKHFFVYRRGPQLVSMANFETHEAAEKWVQKAKEAAKS